MKKISSLFARYLKTLVPRIGRNLIFRLLKCGKFFHTKCFHDREKRIFRPQKLRKYLLFARYLETLVSGIGRNLIFSSWIWEKFANTKLDTLETRLLTTGHTRFYRPQKWKNFHTLCEVPWNTGIANRRKSHFQDAKMRNIFSHEPSYHWTLGFTTRIF